MGSPTRIERAGRVDAAGGTRCFLAQFSPRPCDGRLVRCHLISRQVLRRRKLAHLIPDRRTWVWGCGGIVGVGGHHGELDHSRRLRIPRLQLPVDTIALADEVDLLWWLDREYGA